MSTHAGADYILWVSHGFSRLDRGEAKSNYLDDEYRIPLQPVRLTRVERKLPARDRIQGDWFAETIPAAKHPHGMGVSQS